MEEVKKEIAGLALNIFLRLGFKSVNMDELARQMGKSKKTIYKYFTDKNDVVLSAIQVAIEMDKEALLEAIAKGENAIDELTHISEYVSVKMQHIHPSVFFDLERFYPEAWKTMASFRSEFTFETVKANLERGINEGLYRKDVDVFLSAKFFLSILDAVFMLATNLSAETPLLTIHNESVKYHLCSVTNEKGKLYLQRTLFK